jgi:hypothetical protein
MATPKKYEIPKQYVDAQLEAMKSFGAAPKNLSAKEYELLIQRIAVTLEQGMKKARAASA